MSDHTPSLATLSYAFEMRGELPGDMGLFYAGASTARDAFDAARRELPGKTFPKARDIDPGVGSVDAAPLKYRTPRYALPDPHPSFAAPNRKLRDENWFQQLRTREDGKAMTKEEFMKARNQPTNSKNRTRDR